MDTVNTHESDADAQLRMVAETRMAQDRIEAKLDRLLSFVEQVEAEWTTFRAKGVFGILGGFNKR